MKQIAKYSWLVPIALSTACGSARSSPSILQESIDQFNNPDRLSVPVVFEFDPDLIPDSGKSKKAVWSGSWWPLSAGGTGIAMKKYDLVNNSKAALWEEQTAVVSGSISWAGHCNGLAGAGSHERKPQRSVSYKGVIFSPSDIEALLVEKWQGTDAVTLVGKRCKKDPKPDGSGRIPNAECRDFNAAAFHIIIGTMLGIHEKAFVLDIEIGEQVWNYPAVAYSTESVVIDRAEAIQLTNQISSYNFNVSADQFMKVKTSVILATGATKQYQYVLEGTNGRIIGGEWIGSSRYDHPDFAWYMDRPHAANPNLDISVIDRIAAGSF